MTIDDVLTDILAREGGFVNDAIDAGGPTNHGVTAATLGAYRRLGRPATVDEVKALSEAEARDIFRARYVSAPGLDVLPRWLLPIVVDDGVLSGPKTAITSLQQVLGVVADGILGPKTLHAITTKDPAALLTALVKARVMHYVEIVERNPSQMRFLRGWVRRALSFL